MGSPVTRLSPFGESGRMWMHTVVYQSMQVYKLDLGILVTTAGTQCASCKCMKTYVHQARTGSASRPLQSLLVKWTTTFSQQL